MAELADALALGASAARRGGSSPPFRIPRNRNHDRDRLVIVLVIVLVLVLMIVIARGGSQTRPYKFDNQYLGGGSGALLPTRMDPCISSETQCVWQW